MRNHIIKLVFFVSLALAFFSAVVMLLWNALLPSIFGVVEIGFWQALGLIILVRILFSGLGKHPHMMGGFGRGKNPIHEKWMKMSREERKEFFKNRRKFGMGMNCEKRAEFFREMMSDLDDVDKNSEKESDEQ